MEKKIRFYQGNFDAIVAIDQFNEKYIHKQTCLVSYNNFWSVETLCWSDATKVCQRTNWSDDTVVGRIPYWSDDLLVG